MGVVIVVRRRDADEVLRQSRDLQDKLDQMAATLDQFVHALQHEVARLADPEEARPDG